MRTTGFQLKFLKLIESPNIVHWKSAKKKKKNQIGCGLRERFGPNYIQCCEKSKETGNIISFFSYFTWDNLLKQEAVVVKPYEWKFKAIITKNSKL